MKVFPPFRLDTINQCLWRSTEGRGEERITLKPKTYSILAYFVEHPGRLVTQYELLEAVWPGTYVQPEVVKRHIFDLREALGDDSKAPSFLETLPRRGYKFIASVHESERASRTSPAVQLVGRDRELGELESYLQRAMDGQRQIVFVTGEAGIGKTALVDEFRRRSAQSVPLWLTTGQCVEGYGGKEPYYAVLEAFGSLCRHSDDVLRIFATQAPMWLAQFPALIRDDQRASLQREIVGATRQRMLREILIAVETISSDKPLLLTFEDVHWAHHTTIDFIAALARSRASAKLLVIATHRPADAVPAAHPLRPVEQELLVHRLCHRLDLEPLEEEDIAEYLAGGSSETAVPPGLAALLKRHSEGNPLFMLAALEHLQQCGFIKNDAGSWTLSVPLDEISLEVPESLREMIDAQIESLDPEAQRILEVASVNGVQFSGSVSIAPASVDEERFEQICEDLSRRHRVLRRLSSIHFPDGSTSSRYEFSHALYREVLYRRLAPARRAKTHRQIGERLEGLYAGHEATIASELAEHFEHSNDWPGALKYLRLAAENARRRYANREAGVILRRALELCANLAEDERAVWQIRIFSVLGMMYAADSDVRAIETLENAVNLALRHGSVDDQARAVGDWLLPLSRVSASRAMEAADQFLALCERQSGVARAMSRQNGHFFRIWLGGWNDADQAQCLDALGEIRESTDLITRSYFEAQYALLRWVSSEYREADRIFSQSVSNLMGSCEATHVNLLLAYWVHQMFGSSCLAMAGEWGKALDRFRTGVSSLEKNGDEYRARGVRLHQAWAHLHMLDFDGVQSLCESCYPNSETAAKTGWPVLGDPIPVDARICLILRGSAKLGAGNPDGAFTDLSLVRDAMDRQQVLLDWYWRAPLHSALTEVWLKKGDMEKARREAQEFLKASLKTRERTFQALAWEANARVGIASQDHAAVEDCIGNALGLVGRWEMPLAAWRVHATAAEAATDPELSRAQWRLSAETITRLADSLSQSEPSREIFLSAPRVRQILGRQSRASGL
ncbi:MAG TPA: AAA family ATPase [Bryobacteraceae bacterium]|jgi:DNA-binding winged helix-turn-helix (wHTH) protein|nr:AAA family ATPase [Bryobacteraceae bacterium]